MSFEPEKKPRNQGLLMLNSSEMEILRQRGWVMLHGFPRDTMKVSLLELATGLGSPLASRPSGGLVDRLQPVQANRARMASLSRLFGTGMFPFHTDTAHWVNPAHYLVLGCVHAGSGHRGTMLINFFDLNLDAQETSHMAAGVFLVKNGRASLYANIVKPSKSMVRFDPGCMNPVTSRGQLAADILNERLDGIRSVRIAWAEGDVLIVDNWRVLHAREAGESDEGRTLLRVLVKEEKA